MSHKFRAMIATWFPLLLLLLNFTEQATAQDVCPPWFIPDNTSRTGCSCSSSALEVKCGKHFSLLHFGICMTYNSAVGLTEFGRKAPAKVTLSSSLQKNYCHETIIGQLLLLQPYKKSILFETFSLKHSL